LAGVIVSVSAWILLPVGWAIGITAFMIIGVAANWNLDRRIRRTGRITR
jgi:membrane protein implicated in regulation of membrane protease activity